MSVYKPDQVNPDEPESAGTIHYGVATLESGTVHRAATDISPKVTFAALGAAVATIAVWGFEQLTGVDMPTIVEGAVAVVLTFGAGYLVPDNT